MKRFLVLTARGDELRGSVRGSYVVASGAAAALALSSFGGERDAAGTYRLGGDIREGDKLWIVEIASFRSVDPETHKATLPADAFTEAPS